MAIAHDATAEGYRHNSAGTTTEWSHTCTGTDRFLYVHISTYKAGGGDIVTGVTYNGTAMTELTPSQTPQTEIEHYVFYLANPSSGTNTVIVSHSSNNYTWGLSSSYTGVDQTTPIDSNSGGGTGTLGTTITATTTVVASNCWTVSCCVMTNGVTGTTDTLRIRTTAPNTWQQIVDSNGIVGTGSQSLNHSGGNSKRSWHIASLAEASAGGASANNSVFFGGGV